MHDGVNAKDQAAPAGSETQRLLLAMRRRDQSLVILPIVAIIVLAAGLILSDRKFWDSQFSFRAGSVDELSFLTLNLVLYIIFRHRQVRKTYDRLTTETIRAETLSRRLEDLKSILEVSSSVRSTDTLHATLQVIVHNARDCLAGDLAALHLRTDDAGRIDPGATAIADGLDVEVGPVPIGHGIAGVVSYTGRPVILSDPEEVRSRAIEAEGLADMDSVLAVPLHCGTEQIGTVTIGKRSEQSAPFSLADLQLLIVFADYASHVIYSSRMVDERRKVEERLQHTNDALARAQRHMAKNEKLPSIERMVSRLGHDLANPLTSILGYSQLLQKCDLQDREQAYVEAVFGQTRRCQEIVEGFLSYVRGSGSGRFDCNLNEIVQQSLDLERGRLEGLRIRVEPTFDPEITGITGNSFLIQEAVLHLLRNAQDALQETDGERIVTISTSRHGKHARIDVQDSGPGIPSDCEGHIFEPFYSTREDPNSNGLGLTVAAGIIQEHGGVLRHLRDGAGGAHFQIELPVETAAPMLRDAVVLRGTTPPQAATEARFTAVEPSEGRS